MNMPAMKLPTKGTLDTRAIIPRAVRTSKKPAKLALIASKSMFKVPEYAKMINITMTTMNVNAIPEARLNNCPAK